MRKALLILLLILTLGATEAIAITTPAVESGWWIQIVGTTQADTVNLRTGPSQYDAEAWGVWHRGEPMSIHLREKDQGYNHLFIQLSNPQKKQIDAIVMYGDKLVKEYHFTGASESHEVDKR